MYYRNHHAQPPRGREVTVTGKLIQQAFATQIKRDWGLQVSLWEEQLQDMCYTVL